MSTLCEVTKTSLCWQVQPVPIYICDADGNETQLLEMVLFDDIGNTIPHDSTRYDVDDSGFIGDGAGKIRSYFARQDLTPIPKALEPQAGTYSYTPCSANGGGNTTTPPNCTTGYRVLTGGASWTPPSGTKSVSAIAVRGNNSSFTTANGSGTFWRGTGHEWQSSDFGTVGFAGFSITGGGGNHRVQISFVVCN